MYVSYNYLQLLVVFLLSVHLSASCWQQEGRGCEAPESEDCGKSLPHVQWNWHNIEVKLFVSRSKWSRSSLQHNISKSRNATIVK